MKRVLGTLLAALSMSGAALAGEAETSATAGSSRGNRNGTAAATARYAGDVGFAQTRTNSGRVNTAQGVAVGFDRNGLSLSVSNAVAFGQGPALASNFNLSIGRDGRVSHSTGRALSTAPVHRSATAGGSAGNRRGATSFASGKTDRFGRVQAATRANDTGPRLRPAVRRTSRSHRPVIRVQSPRRHRGTGVVRHRRR